MRLVPQPHAGVSSTQVCSAILSGQGSSDSRAVRWISRRASHSPGSIGSQSVKPRSRKVAVKAASSGTPNTGAPNNNGMGAVQQGFVETSNVNVAEELVNMIVAQRGYEMNSKAITTSDQMLARLTQL